MKLETAKDLIDVCRNRGIRLFRADGDRIGFRGKTDAVTDALKNAMRLFKADILAWIDEHTPPVDPLPVKRSEMPKVKPARITQQQADTLAEVIGLGRSGWVKSVRTNRWYEIHPTAISMALTIEGGRLPDNLDDFVNALNGDGIMSDEPKEGI